MAVVTEPWLDKTNLTEWLRIPVTEYVKKQYEGKGDNFLSNMHRLTVKTKDGDKALIIKCRMQEGTAATVLRESSIFRKEVEMYGVTLPRMKKLLTTAIPGNLGRLAPKCWHSSPNFLVFEDLSVDGYKMLNRREGLNLKQCLSLMRKIAMFHAASVAVHEENPKYMKEYSINFFTEPGTRESWTTCFRAMVKMMVEELETWPNEWTVYVEKIRAMENDFLDRLCKVTTKCDSDFNVLVHGDLWINNVLYQSNDVLRLIDFQFVQFTSFAIDLHLTITTSANMNVRTNHTDTLIKEYHTTLNSTLTALGCTRKLLTLDELYEEYRRKAFYGVFGVVMAASVMTSDPDGGFDLDEAMKGRVPGPKMYSEYFRESARLHLPLLNQMGALDFK